MPSLPLSRQAAAKELLRRRRARCSIAEYAQAITIPGKPVSEDPDEWLFHPIETSVSTHHALWMDAADKLVSGALRDEHGREADGVMALAPPGSAKSTYLDVVVPTYLMGKYPGYQVILTGYGSDILRKHGRRARQICGSPAYKAIWGASIRADEKAADQWALDNGSEYMAGGLLSGLTGNRGNLLITDDPVKGRQEADSSVVREAVWNAYSDDAVTRLKPSGKQFLIETRWDEDDPAGRILPVRWAGESGFIDGRDGRLWYVICLQAECTRADDPLGRKIGEYLWLEWFTARHFEPFKRLPRTWHSLFQQVPTAADGRLFKREWFGSYKIAPDRLNKYISFDTAETPDGGDYTFITVWGVSPDANVYILNMWRGQVTTDVWVDALVGNRKEGKPGLIHTYKPEALIPEDDMIFKAVRPFLERRMEEEKVFPIIAAQSHGGRNKAGRASAFQGIASMRRVFLPEDHPLKEEWIDQHLKFDQGRYDDAVDASAAFGRYINLVWEQSVPKPEKPAVALNEVVIRMSDFAPKAQEW